MKGIKHIDHIANRQRVSQHSLHALICFTQRTLFAIAPTINANLSIKINKIVSTTQKRNSVKQILTFRSILFNKKTEINNEHCPNRKQLTATRKDFQ